MLFGGHWSRVDGVVLVFIQHTTSDITTNNFDYVVHYTVLRDEQYAKKTLRNFPTQQIIPLN